MRKILVIIGSDSDLSQCVLGLAYLMEMEKLGQVEVVAVLTNSIHRHHVETVSNVGRYAATGAVAIIAGAGKAAHLPGMIDSILRYEKKNAITTVFGVAFQSATDEEDTLAAILSIEKVPGHQMVFTREHVGSLGFLLACKKAVEDRLPSIIRKHPPESKERSLAEAYAAAIAAEKK